MYFKWLFYFNGFNNFPGELPVAIGAVYGIYHLFFKEPKISGSELFFYKVLALFLLFSVIFFSVIPYKTPWNALGFWLTALILAGYGFVRFYQIIPKTSQKIIFIICISSGFTFLLWQSYYLNFKIYEQPENPFTYAQPLKDINKITGVLNTIKNKSNGNLVPHIDIIVKNSDYWPLPWSLRNFTKIGWWYEVDKESPLADIIIIDPDLEEQLINKIIAQSKPGHFRLYIPLYKEKLPLRPDHFLQVFVTYKIWEEYLR
jgi:predicted membrane-bound mannosyltransferase